MPAGTAIESAAWSYFHPLRRVNKIVANHYGGEEKPLRNEPFHPDSFGYDLPFDLYDARLNGVPDEAGDSWMFSLSMRFALCTSMVLMLKPSFWAISFEEKPSAMSWRISRCREVSTS